MEDSERVKILKAFDETKLGVKGLDAGITKIPHMFYHPPDHTKKTSESGNTTTYKIPLIDPCACKRVVESVRDAPETFGFFQIVNHGIPMSTLEKMKDEVKSFFEQDSEVKKKFYTREHRPFVYNSNFNLYVFIEPVTSPTRVN